MAPRLDEHAEQVVAAPPSISSPFRARCAMQLAGNERSSAGLSSRRKRPAARIPCRVVPSIAAQREAAYGERPSTSASRSACSITQRRYRASRGRPGWYSRGRSTAWPPVDPSGRGDSTVGIGPIPTRPATIAFQHDAGSSPRPVASPRPVMTTGYGGSALSPCTWRILVENRLERKPLIGVAAHDVSDRRGEGDHVILDRAVGARFDGLAQENPAAAIGLARREDRDNRAARYSRQPNRTCRDSKVAVKEGDNLGSLAGNRPIALHDDDLIVEESVAQGHPRRPAVADGRLDHAQFVAQTGPDAFECGRGVALEDDTDPLLVVR